jgi:outer membrane protein
MLQLQKKQVKVVCVLIALVFIGSVVALAVSSSPVKAFASGNSNVGTVDYRQVMSSHPQVQSAQSEMQQAVQDAQKDFEEKSKNMSDQEKSDYYQQTQQRLQQKQQELLDPINKSVEDAVKSVADAKGLSVVIDKNAVVYGGTDITQDVVKKLSK